MVQKISLENFKLDIVKRGHTFIKVSKPEYVTAGKLTAKCKNNHIFTVSARSYRNCRDNKFGQKMVVPVVNEKLLFKI